MNNTVDVNRLVSSFEQQAKAAGYHCADCAATAGYGTFHTDTLAEARAKHVARYEAKPEAK